MADFDPDAYLAKTSGTGAFDPDAYLGIKPKQSTILGEAVRGGKQMLSSMQSGLGSIVAPEAAAIAGVKRGEQINTEAGEGPSFEPVKKAYNERGILPAAGEAISQIPRALAGQGANMATMAGGARLGVMAGTAAAPFLGPFAPAGPVVGGIVGAGAALLPQFMGSNVERQASEQMAEGKPVDINRTKAYTAAAGQALLEGAENYFVLGKGLVKGVLGIKAATKEAESELLKAAQRSVTGTVARGVAKGAAVELPVEVGQQILERAQAGLSLTSPDAMREYGDTLYQTALVAGPLGAVGNISERAHAKAQLEQNAPPPAATTQPTSPAATAPPAQPTAPAAPIAAAPSANYADVFEQKTQLEQGPQTPETTAKVAELDKQLEALSAEAPAEPAAFVPESNEAISARLNETKPETQNANPQLPEVQPTVRARGRKRGVAVPVQPTEIVGAEVGSATPAGAPEESSGQRLVPTEQPVSTGDALKRAQPSALADLAPLPEAPKTPDELFKPTAPANTETVAPAAPTETKAAAPEVAPEVAAAETARQQEAEAVKAKLAEQQAASAKAKTAPEQRKVVAERGARERVGSMPSLVQIKGALQELVKSNKASPKLRAEAKVHLDDLSAKKPNATPEETDLLHELAFNFLTEVAGGKRGLYQSPRENQPSMLKPGEVQTLTNRITAGWKKAPPITVHADESTLPPKIIAQAAKDGMTGKITGVYDPDTKTVHLVEENLKTAQDVESAIVHEIAGHHGLREILGAKYGKIMDSLYNGNAAVRKAADAKMTGENPLDQRTAVEEVLAEMAETGPQAPQERGALRRVYDAIKGFFQDVFGHRDVSDEAVRQIVANARTHVIEGGKAGKGVAGEGAVLYQNKPAPHDDIYKRMGRELTEPDNRSYVDQARETLQGAADKLKTKNGKGPIQRIVDSAADMLDASEPLMRRIRDEVRASLPDDIANRFLTALSMSQASHDSGLATTAILDGGISYDKETSKFKTEDSKYNLKALGATYQKMMDKYGMTLARAREITSDALESKRMVALYGMRDRMMQQAATLEADGKRSAAKSLRNKAGSYTFHMELDEAKAGTELYAMYPEIQEIDDIKQGMRQWLRTFLEETGVWSPETGQWMLDNAEWVPFQREATEEETDKVGFTEYIRGLQAKAKEHQFKGSMRAVHDVMDNFENWAAYSVSRGIKNQKATELAQAAVKYLPDTEAKAVLNPNPKASDRTVSYLEMGSPKYVEFDSAAKAQLFKGTPLMAKSGLPIIGGMIDSLNSVFRGAVVNFPLFPVYQLAMDSMSATYLSGLKPQYAFQIPLTAVNEAIKTLRGTSEAHKELRKFGAVGVHDYDASLSRTNADVEAGLKALGNWGKYKAVMHNVNLASDNAVRQAVYLAAKDSGLSEAAAVEKAFEIINFRTRVGNTQLAAAARNVVFLNSFYAASRVALKVLSSEGISPTERKQARNTLISNLAWIAGASALLAMANTGDDDYEKMSRQEQAGKLTMPGLHGWGIPLRPDVFMLVKLLAETVVRQSSDKYADDPAKLRATLSEGIINATLSGPIPVSQPLKVTVELATNHNFFTGRPIVGSGLEKREGAEQFSAGTSELAKGIGRGTKNLADGIGLGNYFTGVSPVKIDHFIQGMMGMYGGTVVLVTNSLVNNRPSQSMQDTIASLPGMGRVGVKEFDNQTKTDFYALATRVSEAVATANELRASGRGEDFRAYREKNREVLKYQGFVQNIETTLGAIRNQISIISAKTNLSADEKETRIRELKLREQRMLKNHEEAIKKARTAALS